MLKGISPLLSPELLAVICWVGHGEELVLADGYFPAHQFTHTVICADFRACENDEPVYG